MNHVNWSLCLAVGGADIPHVFLRTVWSICRQFSGTRFLCSPYSVPYPCNHCLEAFELRVMWSMALDCYVFLKTLFFIGCSCHQFCGNCGHDNGTAGGKAQAPPAYNPGAPPAYGGGAPSAPPSYGAPPAYGTPSAPTYGVPVNDNVDVVPTAVVYNVGSTTSRRDPWERFSWASLPNEYKNVSVRHTRCTGSFVRCHGLFFAPFIGGQFNPDASLAHRTGSQSATRNKVGME